MTTEWDEYRSILNEIEPYQKWARKQNLKFKKWMTTLGSRPLSKQEADEFVELASAGGHDFDYEKFLEFMESHVAKPARAPRKSVTI